MRKAFEDLIKQLIGGLVGILLLVIFFLGCILVLGISLVVWGFEFSILALILVVISTIVTLVFRKSLIKKIGRTNSSIGIVALSFDILLALQMGVCVIIWLEANLYSFCLLAIATIIATKYGNSNLPWGCM